MISDIELFEFISVYEVTRPIVKKVKAVVNRHTEMLMITVELNGIVVNDSDEISKDDIEKIPDIHLGLPTETADRLESDCSYQSYLEKWLDRELMYRLGIKR